MKPRKYEILPFITPIGQLPSSNTLILVKYMLITIYIHKVYKKAKKFDFQILILWMVTF